MNYLRWIAGWALVSACGASTPATTPSTTTTPVETQPSQISAPVHKRGGEKLIAMVGPGGGTLELDNGARVVIPEGALTDPVEITFAEGARTTAFSNHDYERPLGPTLEIAPELTPGSALEVSIPLGQLPDGFEASDLAIGIEVPATRQRAIEGQSTQTRWDYNEASSKSGRAVAALSEVPGYRVQFVVSKND